MKAEERKVRKEWFNGVVFHFDGVRGKERMVRIEFPDGREVLYD